MDVQVSPERSDRLPGRRHCPFFPRLPPYRSPIGVLGSARSICPNRDPAALPDTGRTRLSCVPTWTHASALCGI